ncbi:MAG: hypothetical protein Q7J68_06365 [Thermoplasmata archaeon]|nr:hypothetical protein [Thermoplasmata archaeon]
MEAVCIVQFKVFYRVGVAGEKAVLLDERITDSYYGICFGANVACFGRNWISQFIKTINKPFFIDPVTYVIQFDVENISKEGELKKSYSKLFSEYGLPVMETNKQMKPTDFNDDRLTLFIQKVLDFQKNFTQSASGSQQSLFDYAELLGDPVPSSSKVPEFLIAPYFLFENTDDGWYALNLKILAISKQRSDDIPIYGMICTNFDTLQKSSEVKKIIEDYSKMDGIILWISDLNEYRMNRDELISYLKFINQLKNIKCDCITLYGSYFSMLASKFGLNGISPGIGISEFKRVRDQPTGGTFSNKYYIPEAKTMAVEADARTFYVDNPSTLCTCVICKGEEINTIKDIHSFFEELDSTKAKSHYCMNRYLELEKIKSLSEGELQSILDNDIEFCETNIGQVYKIPFSHLFSWKSAIAKFVSERDDTSS